MGGKADCALGLETLRGSVAVAMTPFTVAIVFRIPFEYGRPHPGNQTSFNSGWAG